MAATKIDWTDKVWNPTTGCTLDCNYCYAEKMAHRLKRMGQAKYASGFKPAIHPAELEKPLHWKKPLRIFVNSMGDLFDPSIPYNYIDQIMAIIARCPQHTFQILTKRPERMLDYFTSNASPSYSRQGAVQNHLDYHHAKTASPDQFGKTGRIILGRDIAWPLSNLWLGVTVEHQTAADYRIPFLIKTPAQIRFISIEPMLGPVNLHTIAGKSDGWSTLIDWVICGGGTGPAAKPLSIKWIRTLRDQVIQAGRPFFFKQWGEWAPGALYEGTAPWNAWKEIRAGETEPRNLSLYGDEAAKGHELVVKIGKQRAGHIIDGQEWRQFPC